MLKPEIVSPAAARDMYEKADAFGNETDERLMGRTEFALAYTVATEPDRIRAAVVKALRDEVQSLTSKASSPRGELQYTEL